MLLKNKKILVGVTGGIAVYKTCTLINMLIKEGAEVRVVMTNAAKQFVSPLTFQSLTNNHVYDDMWKPADNTIIEHISVSRWSDIIVISPITANTISQLAHGMADNLLTTIVLASPPQIKVLIAPAMNVNMWENPLTQNNLKILQNISKFVLVDPRTGILACRDEGKGKIAESTDIFEEILKIVK